MSGKSGNQRQGAFERVSLGELVGSSPAFAEQVRRSRDVLEGGALVRRMREMADGGAGISQEELARRLGLSQARISAIEKGGGPQGPTYELLKRIARACDVSFEPVLQHSEAAHLGRYQQVAAAAKAELAADLGHTFEELFVASKQSLDAWTQANQMFADDAQVLLKRQSEIFTGYVNEYVATVQEMMSGEPLDEKQYNKRLTQVKAAYETGLANVRELYGIAMKANNEALDVLSKAFMAQFDQATAAVRNEDAPKADCKRPARRSNVGG